MKGRRTFLSQIAALFTMPQIFSGKMRTFIITTSQNIQTNQPVKVKATSSIDAVLCLGLMWEEDRWIETEARISKLDIPEPYRTKEPKSIEELREIQYKELAERTVKP